MGPELRLRRQLGTLFVVPGPRWALRGQLTA